MSSDAPKSFTVVASVDDPLSADRLVACLTAEGLDAFDRARNQASTDTFGSIAKAYWEILVEAQAYEKAQALVQTELEAIAADAEANAQAADEESQSGETPIES